MRMLANPSVPRRACLAALVAVLLAPAAGAGEVSLTLDGGWHDLTNAGNSAKAVFDGESGGPTFGFAGEFGLGESFFIRAGARYFQRDGERVFVASPVSPAFRLGHPLSVRIIPAYGLIGFKFLPGGSLRPYVGVGGGATSYNEESDVAGEIFESTATKAAGHAVGGLDYGRGTIRFGAEVMYSIVPNAIGFGGVSQIYGEDDIGGLSVLLRISFVH
jgi:Outer membrane protein beta-barrel domain